MIWFFHVFDKIHNVFLILQSEVSFTVRNLLRSACLLDVKEHHKYCERGINLEHSAKHTFSIFTCLRKLLSLVELLSLQVSCGKTMSEMFTTILIGKVFSRIAQVKLID